MNVLVTNVYSTRNKGDHALIDAVLRVVEKPGVEVSIVAADRDAIARFYAKYAVVSVPWECRMRNKLFKRAANLVGMIAFLADIFLTRGRCTSLGRALRKADLVVACPGGYLEDTSSSMYGMLAQQAGAVALKKRLILSPQSIGPFRKPQSAQRVCRVLQRADRIFVRENISHDIVRNWSLPRVSHSPDLVLSDPWFRMARPTTRSGVGLTVVDAHYYLGDAGAKEYARKLTEIVQALLRAGLAVTAVTQTVGFPGGSSDEDILDQIEQNTTIDRVRLIEDLPTYITKISQSRIFIGSRLHSCLFALKQGIPALCLSYQHKATGIYNEMGLDDLIFDIRTFQAAQILTLVNRLQGDTEYYQQTQDRIDRAIAAAEKRGIEFSDYVSGVIQTGVRK